MFNRTDTTCWQIKTGMVSYLGGDHNLFNKNTSFFLGFRSLGGIWAKSCNSGGGFSTYFSTLKVQRHQSKAPEQVSKHAYVAASKRCDWFFVGAILFNTFHVYVVEQIPTAFCSTTFSNNSYACDPRSVWILYQNHSSLYQHLYWNCCWVKHTNLKHLHVKTL